MSQHGSDAVAGGKSTAKLNYRTSPCRKPCSMFRKAYSLQNAGVILRRPFEKLWIGLPQKLNLAGSQALDSNGCVDVKEDDKIESVLQLKAPVHYGTGQHRAPFRPHIAETGCQPFRAISLGCERWHSRQPIVVVCLKVGNPKLVGQRCAER